MHPLFRDVTDHIRTVQEKIDNLREVLAFAFEASLLIGPEPGDGDRQEARLLGGHPRGADRGRRHLRHELRAHAGAELDLRLSDGRGRHSYRLLHPLLAVQKEWVALTWVSYARSILPLAAWLVGTFVPIGLPGSDNRWLRLGHFCFSPQLDSACGLP